MKWIRRVGLVLVSVIVLAVLAGAGYETAGRRRATKDFPVLGKLVDIGGRRIQIDCRGSGTPTVVFEDGLDMGGSLSWSTVHDSIAKNTRACAYSRAGVMWSDANAGPQTGKTVAEDLHLALAKAGERPPFVMVGHSLGGPYIMIYTKYFGSEVAGLVFVDASHPEQVARVRSLTPMTLAASTKPLRVAALFSRVGLVRKFAATDSAPPEPISAVKGTAAYASTSLPAMLKEVDGFDQTLAEAGTFRQLGNRPLFVLTAAAPMSKADLAAMKMTPAQGQQYQARWVEMQNDEASWSSCSQHQSVDSGHYIQFERPQVVIAAVRSVIDSVRRSGCRTR
jgi:pimeloyl-ACP methyl ester carboxylesterase